MSIKSQLQQIIRIKKEKLKNAGLILEGEMHKLVAIDTGDLDRSIKTGSVKENISELSIEVGTELEYAKFVEYGTRGEIKNYHRKGRVVYSGVGQKFAQRALANKKAEIINKVQ